MILAFGGVNMSPLPQGHNPAIARMSVLFPVPESPLIKTLSPGDIMASALSIMSLPSCSAMLSSRRCSRSSGLAPRVMLSPGREEATLVSRRSIASDSCIPRFDDANESASRTALSASQFNSTWTCTNAAAACISEPSVSSPVRYLGAPSRRGTAQGLSYPISSVKRLRHAKTWFALTSYRRTTIETDALGTSVAATISRFSVSGQRLFRRRP